MKVQVASEINIFQKQIFGSYSIHVSLLKSTHHFDRNLFIEKTTEVSQASYPIAPATLFSSRQIAANISRDN